MLRSVCDGNNELKNNKYELVTRNHNLWIHKLIIMYSNGVNKQKVARQCRFVSMALSAAHLIIIMTSGTGNASLHFYYIQRALHTETLSRLATFCFGFSIDISTLWTFDGDDDVAWWAVGFASNSRRTFWNLAEFTKKFPFCLFASTAHVCA